MAPVGSVLPSNCERDVLAQGFGHDARADDGRDQQGGPKRLRGQPARQIELPASACLSLPDGRAVHAADVAQPVPSDSGSMLANGRLVNAAIRFLR